MQVRVFLIIFFFSFSAQAAQWPKPNLDNCDFYSELEEKLHCKKEGVNYLSDYAPFYCKRFKEESLTWSTPLKSWVQKTNQCLQEMLYEQKNNPALDCKTLEEEAFKIHSKCYNEGELCKLKLSDIYRVFKTIKLKDYWREFRYSDGGMLRLINFCLKEHF
jgi:hypothetical protein